MCSRLADFVGRVTSTWTSAVCWVDCSPLGTSTKRSWIDDSGVLLMDRTPQKHRMFMTMIIYNVIYYHLQALGGSCKLALSWKWCEPDKSLQRTTWLYNYLPTHNCSFTQTSNVCKTKGLCFLFILVISCHVLEVSYRCAISRRVAERSEQNCGLFILDLFWNCWAI